MTGMFADVRLSDRDGIHEIRGLTPLQQACLVGGLVVIAIVSTAIVVELDADVLRGIQNVSAALPVLVALLVPKRNRECGLSWQPWPPLRWGTSSFPG